MSKAKTRKHGLSFLNSFQFCRPKNHSSMVRTPLPAPTFSPVNSKQFDISFPYFPDPPPPTPSQVIPLGCAFQSRSCTVTVQGTTRRTHSTPRNKATMYNSPVSSTDFDETDWPIAPSRTEKKKKDKSTIKKSRASTNDEAECSLLSFPHSFNSVSLAEEEPLNWSKKAVERTRFRARRFKRYGSKEWKDGAIAAPETESGDQEKKHGKVNESFVVVKRSVDPFEDFKKSMLEMILEKQMFEHKELEQLLMSFLSLNSRMHHRVIVEAFTEILKEVFCG
ncbi:Transcription repressor OFP7 [Sesamum angolense]|uniref:Transcription repressor n=1 Tax=Sesamum angolense TaxID=2727404 RepID=A0AAE1WC63_9LAMI|nr:Transcription repressor OFP7 [Sesamum angolense]